MDRTINASKCESYLDGVVLAAMIQPFYSSPLTISLCNPSFVRSFSLLSFSLLLFSLRYSCHQTVSEARRERGRREGGSRLGVVIGRTNERTNERTLAASLPSPPFPAGFEGGRKREEGRVASSVVPSLLHVQDCGTEGEAVWDGFTKVEQELTATAIEQKGFKKLPHAFSQ